MNKLPSIAYLVLSGYMRENYPLEYWLKIRLQVVFKNKLKTIIKTS